MRDKNTIIICGIICIALTICGILFWPTLYRYDKTSFRGNRLGQYMVKINRITGYTEILYESGWKPKKVEKKAIGMPKGEKDKIEINGYFLSDEKHPFDKFIGPSAIYNGGIYNGTIWTIKNLLISIGGKDKDGKIKWKKTYAASIDVAPFSTGSFSIKLMDFVYTLNPEVKIEEVFGYKSE